MKIAAFWFGGLIFIASVFGDTPQEATDQALSLIDTAARNTKLLPGYVTVSYELIGNNIVTIKRYVRNDPDRLHLSRTECTTEQMNFSGKGKTTSEIFLCNRDGFWLLRDKKAVRLDGEPQLVRAVPLRLTTPVLLGIKDKIDYTVEKNTYYFGSSCTKVIASISPKFVQKMRDHPEILKESVKTILQQLDQGTTSEDVFEKEWLQLAQTFYPVTYVYLINNHAPFILSWQSYSFTGKKINEVSYQEFKINVSLPDSLFDIPADYTGIGDQQTNAQLGTTKP